MDKKLQVKYDYLFRATAARWQELSHAVDVVKHFGGHVFFSK